MYGLPTTFSCSFLDCVSEKVGRLLSSWTRRLSQMQAFEMQQLANIASSLTHMLDYEHHMQSQAGTTVSVLPRKLCCQVVAWWGKKGHLLGIVSS